MKIVSSLFKEDAITKQLKHIGLITNTLDSIFLADSLKFYDHMVNQYRQQELIKHLLKFFEEKGNTMKKIKMLVVWTQIFKVTKYDLSDILLNKKLKIFTKTASLKQPPNSPLTKNNIDDYMLVHIMVPLYNYFMKLSVNQDLFKHCVSGKVPDNQIFRRGTKIRYIWVFKIYNLINSLLSILSPCCQVLKKFPELIGLYEITQILYNDVLTMNNFVIEAIEEGCEDNFLLIPYFDLLQFYESLTEQKELSEKINQIYITLQGILIVVKDQRRLRSKDETNYELKKENKQIEIQGDNFEIKQPRQMIIDPELMEEIQTQTLKVKLISCSLKNPKKSHVNLETEYHQKLNNFRSRTLQTEDNERCKNLTEINRKEEDFIEKFRNLD